MEAGKRRTGVGAGTDCREAGHWLSSQGLGLRRELPAPRHPLLLPPRGSLAAESARWASAKPNSCQGERKKHFRAERPLWAPAQC